MITLIHGNFTESSRREFIRLKNDAKEKDVRSLEGRTLDAAGLTQALESNSLFGGGTVVFIENLFGKLGRKIKLIEALAEIINKSSVDVILWEDKEVSATVLKNLSKADVKLYKTPAIIFQFLDQPTLKLYATLTENEAPELVHAMLAKRIRQLIQLKENVVPVGLSGWQLTRLTSQAKLFTMDKLLDMYKKLLDMEFSIKNGSSPFSLSQLTQQLLVDL